MVNIAEEFAIPCPNCGETLEKFITAKMVRFSLFCPVQACDELIATCCACNTRVTYTRKQARRGKLTARQYVARYFQRSVEDPNE